MERVDVAIIGGGISGLTAGFELVSNGLSVKVFEGGEVGGLIQTDRVESRCGGSFLLEKGPNLFVAKPALVELLARLKLNNEIVRSVVPNYRQYIWDGIRPVAVAKDPIALIGSPLASLPEKIRLLYSLFSGCATNDSGEVDGEDLLSRSKNSHSSEDISILQFLSPIFGERIVREIVDTSLKGIYGGNVEDLSARSIFPGLWDARKRGVSVYRYLKQKSQASRHHFDRIRLELIGRSGDENNEPLDLRSGEIITLRGGNNLLPITIAKKLGESIVKGFVTKIVNGDGYYLLSSREGREVCAKRVIFACPAGSVASLIKGLGGGLSSDLFSRFEEKLLSVKRAPLIVVHLGLADSFGVLPDKGFGVLFPRGEPSRLLGVMFNSQLFPHYAPKGNKLLTVCVGGVGGERILEYDDNLITKLVVSILERRLRLSKLEALKVTRWPEAIPQYEVGHWRFAAVIDELEKVVPGIYFVGAERGGVGVADRVAEGMRVAKSICSAEA